MGQRFCMTVYEIDPTKDERWDVFLYAQAGASIFHTRGWLEALRRTYGYTPVAFTTSPPGCPLKDGFPFCEISSWLSGCRLVSLPFSDHCQPLIESPDELTHLLSYLEQKRRTARWSYIEVRPSGTVMTKGTTFARSKSFFFHKLNLHPSQHQIFHNLHKDCVQRKIQRAERENLVCEEGRSDSLLTKFYRLLLTTRRRHGLPPQPVDWFQNLIACLGENVTIRVASKNERPIAGILTLCYKDILVYKYGCSDANYNNLGATPWLLWRAIATAKSSGAIEFDMGRTDMDNPGLLAFKNHWVPQPTQLVYLRFPHAKPLDAPGEWKIRFGKRVFSCMPKDLLRLMGKLIYRHIG